MEPSEIEFLAESLVVSVVPNFNEGVMYLLSGEFGPFRAGLPLKVPLWLAVNLRSRRKCRILQPDFLSLEKLEEVCEQEKETSYFTRLPSDHLFVAAQLLMDVATQDFGADADKIKMVLKDIWDIRQAKLRKSVDAFIQSGLQHAKLDHLQLMELNSVRPLLPMTLDRVHEIELAAAQLAQRSSASGSQFNNSSVHQSSNTF